MIFVYLVIQDVNYIVKSTLVHSSRVPKERPHSFWRLLNVSYLLQPILSILLFKAGESIWLEGTSCLSSHLLCSFSREVYVNGQCVGRWTTKVNMLTLCTVYTFFQKRMWPPTKMRTTSDIFWHNLSYSFIFCDLFCFKCQL